MGQRIDRGFDEFEAQKLKEPEQLPEIEQDNFTLVWDFEEDKASEKARTLIKCKDVLIFSEPARFEEYRRFEQVAEILKGKYGDHLKDLVPTERSELYLYGDPKNGVAFVEDVRVRLFGATIVKPAPEPEDDSLFHRPTFADVALELAARDDLENQVEPSEPRSKRSDDPHLQPAPTIHRRGTMRPVPGLPGIACERTKEGTSLVMNPDPEFDHFPDEVRADIIRRLMKCCALAQHMDRVTALRDEFTKITEEEKHED